MTCFMLDIVCTDIRIRLLQRARTTIASVGCSEVGLLDA